MANDVVRDTRDALIRRGNQLQVTCDRRRALFISTSHTDRVRLIVPSGCRMRRRCLVASRSVLWVAV